MENEALAQEMLAIFDNSQPQNTASKVSSKMHIWERDEKPYMFDLK